MERTAKTLKPEFIYGIGDNFYFWGVENVYDVMWTKTFENVYQRQGSFFCNLKIYLGCEVLRCQMMKIYHLKFKSRQREG